jgi:hypothetical protein
VFNRYVAALGATRLTGRLRFHPITLSRKLGSGDWRGCPFNSPAG